MSYGSLEFNALAVSFSAHGKLGTVERLLINLCCILQRGLVEFTMDKIWSLISLSKAFSLVEQKPMGLYDNAQLL